MPSVALNKERDAIKEANTLVARARAGTNDENDYQIRQLLADAFMYRHGKGKYIWELLRQKAEAQGFEWSCKRKRNAQV
jgi:hypothetical protein